MVSFAFFGLLFESRARHARRVYLFVDISTVAQGIGLDGVVMMAISGLWYPGERQV